MTKEKHANIPFFIPHLGCSHLCVFCDQRKITGAEAPDADALRRTLDAALKTTGGRKTELAFFGGSFTAIDRNYMISLLEAAQPALKNGALSGIRLSTRPDAVSDEMLDILQEYGVSSIELGVQSMDDEVLSASGRGHTAKETEEAFCRITARGAFSLVGQMMLGLPCSDYEKERFTARRICEMGADGARIYPTVVLSGTALEKMMNDGSYTPLTLEEGVWRGARMLEIFEEHGTAVLRTGLCAEERCENAVVGGCWHPAYGELVQSRLYYEKFISRFENDPPSCGKTYIIRVAKGALSRAIGHGGENRTKLQERYRCRLKFAEKEELCGRDFSIEEG